MTIALMKALLVIFEACIQQNSCKTCPMRNFCQKMPSEWDTTDNNAE